MGAGRGPSKASAGLGAVAENRVSGASLVAGTGVGVKGGGMRAS